LISDALAEVPDKSMPVSTTATAAIAAASSGFAGKSSPPL
jgi:hypothetical protein